MSIIILTIFTIIFLWFIYNTTGKQILSPAFLFCSTFLMSELVLVANIGYLPFDLSYEAIFIILCGIFMVWLGTIFKKRIRLRGRIAISSLYHSCCASRQSYKFLFFSLLNILTIFIVGSAVINLTFSYGYQGSELGAIGRYRELNAVFREEMRLGLMPTLFTAIAEADGYVVGCLIAKTLALKSKPTIWMWICFVTSFLSTFAQGGRGGIYMIITSAIIYIQYVYTYRGIKIFELKNMLRLLFFSLSGLLIFYYSAELLGKSWNVPFFEYFSVYTGYPILNFDTALNKGIEMAPLLGYYAFGALYQYVFRHIGITMPYYSLGDFQYRDGHNLGNVYTIFGYSIADFGVVGTMIMLFFIGYISQFLLEQSLNSEDDISIIKIVCGYMLTSILFSFFANKFFENISVFRFYELLFIVIIKYLLTKNCSTNILAQ